MKDYQNHEKNIMNFFEYKPLDKFEERLQYLNEKSFKRQDLAETLHKINKDWDASPQTLNNIERLKDEQSVVVIGGQQAGILSGPMYTINKIISIIKLAKQQEEKLNIPVVPIFWIAGEDHDFLEVNHIHVMDLPEIKKHPINQYVEERTPVSEIEIDQDKAKQWIDEVFLYLRESMYSKEVYKQVHQCLSKSKTYVDFFAQFINLLFEKDGLVLIDSNNPLIRQIESEYFVKLINEQEVVSKEIYHTTHLVRQAGYELTIEPEIEDAHLFYHLKKERILLTRTEDGLWEGKQEEIKFTTEEMLAIAKNNPERLSNNVVTRPLMQDMLFPTLAFVGGWGEISYWSVLRGAFQCLNMKMPPVVPRLSFTYVEPKIAKLMEKYSLKYEQILSRGVSKERINWINSQSTYPTDILSEQIKKDIDELHKPLRKIAEKVNPNLKEMSESNLYFIYDKIDFLVNSIKKEVEKKYEKNLVDFSFIQLSLFPNHLLQERIFNPIYFLNHFGSNFIDQLIEQKCSFREDHFLVFL